MNDSVCVCVAGLIANQQRMRNRIMKKKNLKLKIATWRKWRRIQLLGLKMFVPVPISISFDISNPIYRNTIQHLALECSMTSRSALTLLYWCIYFFRYSVIGLKSTYTRCLVSLKRKIEFFLLHRIFPGRKADRQQQPWPWFELYRQTFIDIRVGMRLDKKPWKINNKHRKSWLALVSKKERRTRPLR